MRQYILEIEMLIYINKYAIIKVQKRKERGETIISE